MAKRGMSISIKLIIGSTLLLVVAVGVFGFINSIQSRRIIDDSAKRLEKQFADALRRGGEGQLRLLVASSRIALLQSDYTALQAIAANVKKRDDQVTGVAVVDDSGTLLAHQDAKKVGKKAEGLLEELLKAKKNVVKNATVDGQRSLVLAAPVVHEKSRLGMVFLAFRSNRWKSSSKRQRKSKSAS
jgi:sensor histidine kinase regulating citrate/malate metabolism